MYYRLGYTYPRGEDDSHYMIEDGIDFDGVRSWAIGQPITTSLPNPIMLDLIPVNDYSGVPPDMFDGYMCLMSTKMAAVLLSCGVDNLQLFPATLIDKTNEKQFEYCAVNIIGLVAAADLRKSEWQNPDGEAKFDTFFTTLVIDPLKAREHLIFRLAEDTSSIVIHDSVKTKLEAQGLTTLTFTPTT